MTLERWLLLVFAATNAMAGVVAGGAQMAGLPAWAGLVAAAVVAGSAGALVFLRGWFDAAPVTPH